MKHQYTLADMINVCRLMVELLTLIITFTR